MDFQKAFDTVNHKTLLRKLEHYGIRRIVNSNMCLLEMQNIEQIAHGVPQGSVLGPLCDIRYIIIVD